MLMIYCWYFALGMWLMVGNGNEILFVFLFGHVLQGT